MSMSTITICRACLTKCPDDKVAFDTLKNVFIELTSLQDTPSIDLPNFLCGKCGELLTQFKSFKDTCIESDTHLRKAISNATFPLLPVESIKVESQTFDDEYMPSKSSPPSLRRRRKPAKKPENSTNRRRTRVKPKSPEKEEAVESSNESDNREDDASECYTERRKTRATKKKSTPVGSSNESDDQGNESSDTKQEVDDRSEDDDDDDDDEEFNEPPKKGGKSSQSRSDELLPYSCTKPKCRKKFRHEHRLEAHMKKHDGIDPTICDICERPLTSVANMVRHRLTHRSIEERLHKCKVCNKIMMSEKTLKYHMKTHEASKSFVCDICGLGYISIWALKNHRNTHNTDQSTFQCKLCPKSYSAYSSLFTHVKTKHEKKESSVQCGICGKVVVSKKFLFSHCRNKHTVYTTTENVYQCKHCDMKCKSTRSLKNHERLHTGERKYKCTLCPKSFAHLAILKKHSYFHSGERPVRCDVCDKGFYQKSALDIHMNVHKKQWIAQGLQGITLTSYSQSRKKGTNSSTAEFGDYAADSTG